MPILYIVATPIGNLKDITLRAIDILKSVDLILCEDTRMTKKLLDCYQIKTPTLSYYQHSKIQKIDYIKNLLKRDKKLALVSDAGTPGISDPGNKLIKEVLEAQIALLEIVPIPGPSALGAAVSVSGFATDKFLFLGFPPAKKKRKKFFEEMVFHLANARYPVIFYESPHRILKTLDELKALNENLEVMVSRELTKKFESIYRGKTEKVIKEIKEGEIKGEFVVVVKGENKI